MQEDESFAEQEDPSRISNLEAAISSASPDDFVNDSPLYSTSSLEGDDSSDSDSMTAYNNELNWLSASNSMFTDSGTSSQAEEDAAAAQQENELLTESGSGQSWLGGSAGLTSAIGAYQTVTTGSSQVADETAALGFSPTGMQYSSLAGQMSMLGQNCPAYGANAGAGTGLVYGAANVAGCVALSILCPPAGAVMLGGRPGDDDCQ
jgi:hypothetical protein